MTAEDPAPASEKTGPFYSQLTTAADFVFISGQVGVAQPGQPASADMETQVEQVYANLGRVLGEAQCSFGDVLKFTTYVVDRKNLAAFNAVRQRLYADLYPDGEYPGNTLVVVTGLASPDLLVEIEAVAHRPQ